MAFALGGGFALALLWGLACPWLIGLGAELGPAATAALLAGGIAVGLVAVALLPRSDFGALGAFRLGLGLTLAGLAGALAIAAAGARPLGSAPALALALCAFGCAVSVALLATVLAFRIDRRRADRGRGGRGAGVPLRRMVAATSGALAVAAWALACGHVLGQRATDASHHAAFEARNVVAIYSARTLLAPGAGALLGALAPDGGYLVIVADGRVENGVGAEVAAGTRFQFREGPPPTCTLGRRTLPCAVRQLADGTQVAAAVPARPLGARMVLLFALAGLGLALGAIGIGGLVGASTARDLERVAETVDDLRRSAKSLQAALDLDRPIVVASLDEAGELAAALGRLRAHLQPIIEEYRAALERAQAADQARDEFLSLVSAELRSPLNQIIASAEALLTLRADPLTAEQRDDVKTVLSASRHLIDLIDEVLDVSAIATGQVSLRLSEVDLGALTADVAKAQRPIVQKKGVEVKLSCDRPSPRVTGDERRLRQVLTNIISNAVKFTDRGAIEIAVAQKGLRVEVSVKDTGPGIAPESLGKLFREFVQLGSLKQRAYGTGLGLAICKRLVDAHDGEVWAESTPGAGSTFHVVVPVAGPAPRVAVTDDTPVQGVEELAE